MTFWKPNEVDGHQVTDVMHHRCPLFAPMLAISPQAALAVDTLHTLYFGPAMRLVSAIAWRVLAMNTWGFRGAKAAVLEQGCRQLRAHVLQWFVYENVPNNLRIGDLNLKMLGGPDGTTGCTMKRKAVETVTVLPWALRLASEFDIPQAPELLATGQALMRHLEIIWGNGMCMPRTAVSELLECAQRAVPLSERAQIHLVPKHHMFIHM